MSEWRRVAIELIPSLTKQIAESDDRTELWDILREQFINAAENKNPMMCSAVMKYYRWCVSAERQSLPNDVQTSAVLGFLEKMVRTPALIEILLLWLSKEEVLEYSWNVAYTAGKSTVEDIQRMRSGVPRKSGGWRS